jgi:hypothetical protein
MGTSSARLDKNRAIQTNGEQLYLLYRVSTEEWWCNAAQTRTKRFSGKELEGISFVANK